QWEMGGIDARGRMHRDLARRRVPIPFPHRKVAHAHTLEIKLPETMMLCSLLLTARTEEGVTLAQNFVHYFVSNGYPPEREESERTLILRGTPANWATAEWSETAGERDQARAEDCCYGSGSGFFEWALPLDGAE